MSFKIQLLASCIFNSLIYSRRTPNLTLANLLVGGDGADLSVTDVEFVEYAPAVAGGQGQFAFGFEETVDHILSGKRGGAQQDETEKEEVRLLRKHGGVFW